jgi:putative CocE/NonD family hydrolase
VNHLVVGPWRHGGWARGEGRTLGPLDFGSPTSEYYRERVEAPFFARHLKGASTPRLPEALAFQTGADEWERYEAWPPGAAERRNLYLSADGRLSFEPPTAGPGSFDEYVSDPDRPVPYWNRPLPGFWQGGQALWKVADQRFVHLRPDVLSWETGPLEEDVIVSGPIVAKLFASTNGTDADWVVKLIDLYPEEYAADPEMGGYQLMIADEVLRARFRDSFERAEPVPSNEVVAYQIDLNSRNHVFRKGHRIMVQVQSTWFPLIDRNPQTYVENIFEATEEDFVKATHRVYRSRRFPSHLVLPIGTR